MENKIVTILLFVFFNFTFCQVGINTTSLKATFDVVGNPSNTSEIDGIIIPRITLDELISKDNVYGINQIGVIVYVTAISEFSSPKTINIDDVGYYYFDGTIWLKLSYRALNEVGDIKSRFIPSDHNGWIKLDGRAIASLNLSQQTNSTSLGFVDYLLNASYRVLVQVSPLASVSNASLLVQSQLPNIQLTDSKLIDGIHNHTIDPFSVDTSSNGCHTHSSNANGSIGGCGLIRRSSFLQSVTATGFDSGGSGVEPDLSAIVCALTINPSVSHTHSVDIPVTQSSSEGSHNHTITTTSINGDVIQQPLSIDNLPRLNVNMFI